MSDGIQLIIKEGGAAEVYDDAYDLTIHCTSEDEQREILKLMETEAKLRRLKSHGDLKLVNLPSAQPELKEGHWIPHETPDGGEQYECSLCGVLWEFADGTPEDNEAYFCQKCGKKLITK